MGIPSIIGVDEYWIWVLHLCAYKYIYIYAYLTKDGQILNYTVCNLKFALLKSLWKISYLPDVRGLYIVIYWLCKWLSFDRISLGKIKGKLAVCHNLL